MGIKDNVLFVRNEQNLEPDSAEDVWDDTLLIKAYERAVNLAKEKLARKENEGTENADAGGSESDNIEVKENKKVNRQIPWKVGCSCRATYSEDGQEYEATIIRLMHWKGKCIVRYLGYGNEEELDVSTLKPSRGERVRSIQQMESGNVNVMSDDYTGREQEPPNDIRKFTMSTMIPPPPPLSLMSNFPSDEGEAFSSMLMSWYMSGYHTGYYQGLMRSKMGNQWQQGGMSGLCHQDEMNPTSSN